MAQRNAKLKQARERARNLSSDMRLKKLKLPKAKLLRKPPELPKIEKRARPSRLNSNRHYSLADPEIEFKLPRSTSPYDTESRSLSPIDMYDDIVLRFTEEVETKVAQLRRNKYELQQRSISPAYKEKRSKELFDCLRTGEFRKAKDLLFYNPKLAQEVDSTMQTPLHWATRRNNYALMRQLISLGADINAGDMVGRTPTHIAKHKRHVAAGRLLELAACR